MLPGNGLIDKGELGDLVNTLCDRIGQARPNPASVQRQVNSCLAVYDTDGDGCIDIDGAAASSSYLLSLTLLILTSLFILLTLTLYNTLLLPLASSRPH